MVFTEFRIIPLGGFLMEIKTKIRYLIPCPTQSPTINKLNFLPQKGFRLGVDQAKAWLGLSHNFHGLNSAWLESGLSKNGLA